jgi:hypothetical protein
MRTRTIPITNEEGTSIMVEDQNAEASMSGAAADGDEAFYGDGSTFDSSFKWMGEQPQSDAALGLDSAAAASPTTALNSVNGLTHQIPSSPGKSIQWDPNLVTYMETSSDDFDADATEYYDCSDEMADAGSVHLSEASYDMTSNISSPSSPLDEDDFNAGMRDLNR